MKIMAIKNKPKYLLASMFISVLLLPACSSDDAQEIIDEVVGDVTVEGQITSSANQSGEQGVSVKGIYGSVLGETSPVTTDAGGLYSLVVLKDTPVSLQASKTGFITLNSEKASLSADEKDFDIEMVTSAEADAAINQVFPAQTLAGSAWLVVNVVDGSDVEVGGVTISTTGNPTDTAATNCDGTDSNGDTTIAPCPSERGGPMYFAYFDIDSAEVTVTAGADTKLAPVRRGEVTFLEFVQ
jgi:hypothetical protein